MKKLLRVLLTTLATIGTAQATLIDRGGGLIYDDVLNVTWLQDVNYAAGSLFDNGSSPIDGMMTWQNAVAWVGQLEYGGFNDWRLPTIADTGVAGCQNAFSGTDCGYNVDTSSSELAYMFFVNLGNLASYDTSGAFRGGASGVTWGLVNTGPFNNLEPSLLQAEHWSGTEDSLDPTLALYFSLDYGYQGINGKTGEFHAWAVRDGDVGVMAVSEPTALPLMLTGLAALGVVLRRRRGVDGVNGSSFGR